jgi:anti-anti-sigma factor
MTPNLDPKKETLTLRVAGDLLSTNAEAVRNEITGLLEAAGATPQKWNVFRLDLSSAKMVDSVGLNLVVGLLKQVQKQGAKLQVTYSSQNIFRTFAFTRLDKHIELVKV